MSESGTDTSASTAWFVELAWAQAHGRRDIRTPAIVPGAMAGEADLCAGSYIPRPRPSGSAWIGMVSAKPAAPHPHRLLRPADAGRGLELFKLAATQATTALPPDTMAAELCRRTLARASVGCRCCSQAVRLPYTVGAGQTGKSPQMLP
jgi:hypothetical protein